MTQWTFKGEARWMTVLYVGVPLIGMVVAAAAPWVRRTLGW